VSETASSTRVADHPSPGAAPAVAKRWVLVIALLVTPLPMLNLMGISTSLPRIAAALGVPPTRELWLPDAYLFGIVAVTPLSGYLLRRLGHRRLLTASIVTLLCGSLASGSVTSYPLLLALAVAVGAAGAPILPATQTLVVANMAGRGRALGMSFWNAGNMGGVMLGSLLGGWLSEVVSWHLIFDLCLPLGLVALVLVRRGLPAASRRAEHAEGDVGGATLIIVALVSLGILLNLGDDLGWFRSPVTIGLMLLFVLSAALFAHHCGQAQAPILHFGVLRDRQLALAVTITLGIALFSTGQFEIDLLGGPLGFSSELLGVRGALGSAALIAGVLAAGVALRWTPAPRLVVAALLITAIGKYGFTFYGPGIGRFGAMWPQVVTSFGIGCLNTCLAVVAFDTLSTARRNDASSLYVLAAWLGWMLGLALLGAVQGWLEGGLLTSGLDAPAAEARSLAGIIRIEFVATALLLPLGLLVRPLRRWTEAAEPAGRGPAPEA
jgi:DHA2 family multidrug resistance protein